MLKIENTEVMGWEHAIRGMRNPKNSWEKTDSYPAVDCGKCGKIEREGICKKEDRDCTGFECFEVGPNDLKLMTTLRNAGTDHRKFMRMITVYLDITAPLYWWKELVRLPIPVPRCIRLRIRSLRWRILVASIWIANLIIATGSRA